MSLLLVDYGSSDENDSDDSSDEIVTTSTTAISAKTTSGASGSGSVSVTTGTGTGGNNCSKNTPASISNNTTCAPAVFNSDNDPHISDEEDDFHAISANDSFSQQFTPGPVSDHVSKSETTSAIDEPNYNIVTSDDENDMPHNVNAIHSALVLPAPKTAQTDSVLSTEDVATLEQAPLLSLSGNNYYSVIIFNSLISVFVDNLLVTE